MRRVPVLVATLMLTATAALAQSSVTKFLTEAIQGNFAEVKMGELAQQNGQSEGVKSFGQMLVNDHGEANKKAIDVAKARNVNTPNGPNARQNADYARMSKMTGAAFDKSFVQYMIADHKKDIAAYKKEARQTDSAGQYAQGALPTLEKHLDTAQELQRDRSKR